MSGCALCPGLPCIPNAEGRCMCEQDQPVGFWGAMVDEFYHQHHGEAVERKARDYADAKRRERPDQNSERKG